jgi:hypothetical protein
MSIRGCLIDQAAARPANRLADRSFAFAASMSRFRGGANHEDENGF